MANATKATERRTKTVEENVTVVNLTLEADEASALVQVLRSVGGDRYKGGRVHTDKVLTALQSKAGVLPSDHAFTGNMYFGKSRLVDLGVTTPYVSAAW